MANRTAKKPKNPVCAVWWKDASYSFEKQLPQKTPPLELTVGFIIKSNDDFVHIATDAEYNAKTGHLTPERGHLIPVKTIVKFKKIGNLH